jgi:hypothetical protein
LKQHDDFSFHPEAPVPAKNSRATNWLRAGAELPITRSAGAGQTRAVDLSGDRPGAGGAQDGIAGSRAAIPRVVNWQVTVVWSACGIISSDWCSPGRSLQCDRQARPKSGGGDFAGRTAGRGTRLVR